MDKLTLRRDDGTEIQNEIYLNHNACLGIIFSGIRYNYKKPLLYYSRNLLFEEKIDYIGVDFDYGDDPCFQNPNGEAQNKRIEEDSRIMTAVIQSLLPQYRKCILIGKSLGTSIIRRCIKEPDIRVKASLIILTPGAEWNDFIPELCALENPTLLIASLQDRYYPVERLSQIYKKKNLLLYEARCGNHSLEMGNVDEDIGRLKDILKLEKEFIEKYRLNGA